MRITIAYGPANRLSREVPSGTSVGELVNNPNTRALLGYGSSVQVMCNRRHCDPNTRLYEDTDLQVEALAGAKGANVGVTVRYGPANSITREVPEGTTVGQLIGDPNLKAVLGYGASVRAMIDRAEQDLSSPVVAGDIIDLEAVAGEKGA